MWTDESGGMRRYTESERRRTVRAFEASGLSAAAFCRRRGVSTVTLAQWRKRWAQSPVPRDAPDPTPRPSWLPVVIAGAGSLPAGRDSFAYRMVRGDFRLEVPPGFTLSEVRQLWELLAGESPDITGSRVS